MIVSQADTGSHREQYRGKNLLYLLIALCGPAGLLFLRSVFGRAGEAAGTTAAPDAWLLKLSTALLVIFYVGQIFSAWYMRRMLPPRRAWWSQTLQFLALFVMGLFFSLTGATMLEAFGYSLWIHLKR